MNVAGDNIVATKNIVANGGVNSNTYDSAGNVGVVFKQNGNTFMALQGGNDRTQFERPIRVLDR